MEFHYLECVIRIYLSHLFFVHRDTDLHWGWQAQHFWASHYIRSVVHWCVSVLKGQATKIQAIILLQFSRPSFEMFGKKNEIKAKNIGRLCDAHLKW